jgi:hypothetical protein
MAPYQRSRAGDYFVSQTGPVRQLRTTLDERVAVERETTPGPVVPIGRSPLGFDLVTPAVPRDECGRPVLNQATYSTTASSS